ncbi:MAG: hypothetical protein KBA30_01600 [Clostridia bacterium]|nr:hypothetical protein [Clostridia bacterium]
MTPANNGRRAKGRITLLVLSLLSVMVMAGAVILAFMLADRRQPQTTETTSTAAVIGGFACEPAEAARLHPFGSGVFKVDTARTSFLDMNGTEQWGVDQSMLSPACFVNETMLLVADIGGSSYLVLNENGLVRKGTVSGTLTGAAVSGGQLFALVIEQPENKGRVRVVSAVETKEYEWDFISRKSGYVLSVSFSPDDQWLDVITLDTDRHAAQSMLKRLDAGTGGQAAQYIPEEHGMFSAVVYDDKLDSVMVGSDSAVGFREDATVAYSHAFSRIFRAATTSRGALLAARKEPEGEIGIYLAAADGSLSAGPVLPGEPSALVAAGDLAAVAVGAQVYVLDLDTLTLETEMPAGSEIIRLRLDPDRGLAAVTQDHVGRMPAG